MEKVGFPYEDIVKVYNQVNKMNKTTAKLYLRGGLVPYLLLGESSTRKHNNLDLICSKKDIPMIRANLFGAIQRNLPDWKKKRD